MESDNPFPTYPSRSLSREDVVGHLVELSRKGWNVYLDADSFIMEVNEFSRFRLKLRGPKWIVAHETALPPMLASGTAENLIQLKAVLDRFLGMVTPSSTRTRENEPATNLSKIARLIGAVKVVAVHDPYLDNKGLDNLRVIAHLVDCIDPGVRLLTGSEGAKRLVKNFVDAFFAEFRCPSVEIRKVVSGKPHRRFLLLTGGQSLIIGMSLNDSNKNEALHLEPDTDERCFFDAEWASSSPVF